MKMRFVIAIFIITCASVLIFTPTSADGIIIPDPPICDPCPIRSPMSQLVIRYHHVTVTIEDQIATTHVDQVFYNPNDWVVEGEYVFPIPIDAAVGDFVLWIDGEPVQGEVLDAEQARRVYEEIVAKLRDPALLEYADRGALRAKVFPIPPMAERRIELEYTQALTAENDLVRYIYPLNTEKFSAEPLEDVSITVQLIESQPIRAVYSPTHSVSIHRENNHDVLIGYEDQDVLPEKDFSLYYSLGESEALHLLTFRDPAEIDDPDGFFLMLLAPGIRDSVRTVPKDILLVLDRSGSMDGEKFRQSQEAIRYILNNLNPEDRFNLITFSTGVDVFSQDLLPASKGGEAIRWLNRLHAEGSTDINRALLEAVSLAEKDRPTYLIFLTDGLPTVGIVDSQQIIENIADAAPKNLSIFAFGVGYDVDTFLLDTLVKNHHGSTTYVVPGEQLDEILSGFYNKIRAPVLTDLNLDFGEAFTYDIFPDPLPDLFVGTQVVIVGRYRDGVTTDILLSGVVDGKKETFEYKDQVFREESFDLSGSITALPRLWATRKIGYLLNQVRLNGPDQETIDQIVRLSIRYGIITPYTSYLVTEPLPLGSAERERIITEEFSEFKAQAILPSFGKEAVERAEGQSSLESADSVVSEPEEAIGKVRVIGSHTFVHHDGVWVDTLFEPEHMSTEKIEFLSDDYFRLTRNVPELAQAFALGERVIAVSGGIFYEVTVGDRSEPGNVTLIPKDEQNEESTPVVSELKITKSIPDAPETADGTPIVCSSGLVITFLPIAFLGIQIYKKKNS